MHWYASGTRRVERRSTGTKDLDAAKRALIVFVDGETSLRREQRASPPQSLKPQTLLDFLRTKMPDAVLIRDVLTGYVERLRGRGSHEAARNALRAWTEFCLLHDLLYVHELNDVVQEQFVSWRRQSNASGTPLSNGTINRSLDVLRAAVNHAWRRGQLSALPHIRLIPHPPPRDVFLTQEEVSRLLAACQRPYLYRFVMIAAHTLQRPSAILELRVEQVDLTWNRINFLPAGSSQSNKRRPTVPITAGLRPVLQKAIADSKRGYVIEHLGRPIRTLKRSFAAAAARAGLPHATPGILRHTGATLLAAAGVPIREISGMLGHRNSQITEEVYAKRRPEFLAEAVQALDRLYTASA
jgi:integrase